MRGRGRGKEERRVHTVPQALSIKEKLVNFPVPRVIWWSRPVG